MTKQTTFRDASTGFLANWRLRNERRNSILMTHHYPDLGSASDWLNQISHAARPIRSTTQIWVVTRHQYGISALVSQTSFCGKTSGDSAKCRLFSQTTSNQNHTIVQRRYDVLIAIVKLVLVLVLFTFLFRWKFVFCVIDKQEKAATKNLVFKKLLG